MKQWLPIKIYWAVILEVSNATMEGLISEWQPRPVTLMKNLETNWKSVDTQTVLFKQWNEKLTQPYKDGFWLSLQL